ncbi:transporter [Prolixibacter bellariivorans]|uniref:Probable membrane transporter protein n=2 Tax=Prolixibacter bellariivorans TaxID=314319 RepID=A0A5M4B242_9BACT|nr:sulfite exporter TauE/SafE family protein [Prolixibacter bellariivorans]GET33988.1 transporter [Prolixibacter bellariivorans]
MFTGHTNVFLTYKYLMDIAFLIIIGIFTGLVTGLTGASGVMVVVPLIHLLLKFSIHEAIGTSLLVDVLTPLAIAYTFYKNGNIDMKSGGFVALASIIMALVGARFSDKIPDHGLGSSFASLLIILAIVIWINGIRRDRHSDDSDGQDTEIPDIPVWRNVAAAVLAGGSGFMTGFMGAGGGTNILLILLFVNRFPIHKALGTSILIMSLTAASGVIGHASMGNVSISAGLTIAMAAIFTGIYCARQASKISEKSLSRLMSIVYLVLGVLMFTIQVQTN